MTPLFQLGYGFFGGLTYAGDAGTLYAIGGDLDGIQRNLYLIDIAGGSVTLLDQLSDGDLAFNGGLAFTDRLYMIGDNGEASQLFSYAPLGKVQPLDGLYRSVVFPAAGGLARDPDSETWWAFSLDLDSGLPLLVNFDSSGALSQAGLNAAVTGLTFADGADSVPEPGAALLLAAGLAAILWYKRGAERPEEQGTKS